MPLKKSSYGRLRKVLKRIRKKRVVRKNAMKVSKSRWPTRRANISSLKYLGTGMPQRFLTKLKYTDRGSFVTGTATGSYVIINGNSIWDPINTSAGGGTAFLNQQPAYRDTLSAMYAKYRVIASRIRIECVNSQSTVPTNIIVYPIDTNITPGTSPIQERVIPYSTFKSGKLGTLSPQPIVFNKYMSTAKINGVLPSEVEINPDYGSSVGGSPSDLWYWVIHPAAFDESTNIALWVTFTITYYVEFTNPVVERDND